MSRRLVPRRNPGRHLRNRSSCSTGGRRAPEHIDNRTFLNGPGRIYRWGRSPAETRTCKDCGLFSNGPGPAWFPCQPLDRATEIVVEPLCSAAF